MGMKSDFLLGTLKITPAAKSLLKRLPYDLICRHAIGDHGFVSDEEKRSNERAKTTLGKIISRYRADPTDEQSKSVLVTTERTWTETVVSIE